MKFIKYFILTLVLSFSFVLASCGKAATYEIKFESNGGTTYDALVLEADNNINLPTPLREGHEFVGWYSSADFSGTQLSNPYVVKENATLYAKWDAYKGTISFVTNGGTVYDDLAFEGNCVELPEPTKAGYYFLGWYDNEEFSGDAYQSKFYPKEDLTLYAKWEAYSGTVSFVTNCDITVSNVTVTGQYVKLPTLTKDGYEFKGWYDNPAFEGEAYPSEFLPDGDVILYAKWMSVFSTITFHVDGGTTCDKLSYVGEVLELPTPFKYGYKFLGWYDNANFTGNAYPMEVEDLESSIHLYAKYEKVTYLYMYYGKSVDNLRLEYKNGDVITVDELYELFTPDDMIVTDFAGKEHNVPFLHWAHEGVDEYSLTKVTSNITIGDEHVVLVACYDDSKVPAAANLIYNSEEDSYKTTGKVAHNLLTATSSLYAYSMDVTFAKGNGGGVGPAFRMKLPNTNYQYESGCDYIAVGMLPNNGGIQISGVLGAWSRLVSDLALESLPKSWQDKYNNTEANHLITVTVTIVDRGSSFEIYLDNVLAYTYSDATTLAKYTGKDLGVRSSTTPATLSNIYTHNGVKVSFETYTDEKIEPITWYAGKIELPYIEEDGLALDGWYYDEDLTLLVDDEKFTAKEDVTLHASWSDEYYLISLDECGGQAVNDIRWTYGKISLPTPSRANHIFEGWYYDSAYTNKVDTYNFKANSDITLYAKWRLPHTYFTNNGNGTWSVPQKTAGLLLEDATYDYYQIDSNVTVTKGSSGGVGPLWRGTFTADYQYEKPAIYFSADVCPKNGHLQVCYILNGFHHATGSSDIALANLPSGWQTKYNNAASGASITVKVTIKDFGNGFEVYLDDQLAFSYANTAILNQFTGRGIGYRSSTVGAKFDLKVSEMLEIKALCEGEQVGKFYVAKNTALPELPSLPYTKANGNQIYGSDVDWYYLNTTTPFDISKPITQTTTVEAKIADRVETRNGVIITQDSDGDDVYTFVGNTGVVNQYGGRYGIGLEEIDTAEETLAGEVSEFKFTVTVPQKPIQEIGVRTIAFVNDGGYNPQVTGDKDSNQYFMAVHWNPHNGGFYVTGKLNSGGKQYSQTTIDKIASCAYKEKYNSWTSGSMSFDIKMIYGLDANGYAWFKYYMEDCLLCVVGFDASKNYNSDVNYGTEIDLNNPLVIKNGQTGAAINSSAISAANGPAVADYMKNVGTYANKRGYSIGISMFQDTARCGGSMIYSKISNKVISKESN